MSGHSKWSSIKHKKAIADAKRGNLFTKYIREIMVAARDGGGNPETNYRLRTIITKAKEINMPKDNIIQAIKRGTGELEGVNYEEVTYEGYGAGGIAVMVDVLTDNKNRAAAEIKNIFSKNGGTLGETGCVAWMFERKGLITVSTESISEDDLMAIVLDAGADDMKNIGKSYEIITATEKFEDVLKAIRDKNIKTEVAEITMIPKNLIKLDDTKKIQQLLKLVETLEESDDVQQVYTNLDIPDEIAAAA